MATASTKKLLSAEEFNKLEPSPAQVLVIGAATPFQDQLLERRAHANFILNAVDALSLGEDLIQIRSKEPIDRSIGPISTAARAWWRVLISLLVHLAMMLWFREVVVESEPVELPEATPSFKVRKKTFWFSGLEKKSV